LKRYCIMAQIYLDQLNTLMQRAVGNRFPAAQLTCKHFFSGAAVYANGKICMSLTPVGFALKLPPEVRDRLLKEKGTKPLQYFPQGPIKKEYVILPKRMLIDTRTLRRWVKRCIEYVTHTSPG